MKRKLMNKNWFSKMFVHYIYIAKKLAIITSEITEMKSKTA
jgi:dimeric dUTPase (all-alpha-NTP-PPase superfamily)